MTHLKFEGRIVLSESYCNNYANTRLKPALTKEINEALYSLKHRLDYSTLSSGAQKLFQSRFRYRDYLSIPNHSLKRLLHTFIENINGEDLKDVISNQLTQSCSKKFGALCLCEDPDVKLMWVHYAGEGTGFVVGIDPDHVKVPDADWRSLSPQLKCIDYVSNPPVLEEHDSPERSDNALLFTKLKEWDYEKEWRLIRRLDEVDKVADDTKGWGIYTAKLVPKAIQSVIIG